MEKTLVRKTKNKKQGAMEHDKVKRAKLTLVITKGRFLERHYEHRRDGKRKQRVDGCGRRVPGGRNTGLEATSKREQTFHSRFLDFSGK